jgi:2-amino-4-hydroxy-6-hydroxymethyldihydropteridine diphosphokinase
VARIYLGLGSNLGDRLQNLQDAVDGLGEFLTVVKASPVYETTPWGPVQDQPHFLNACLEAQTDLPVDQLLPAIKALEQQLGRGHTEKWGPHKIDIDLLFYDNEVKQVGERYVPHRQIRQRVFVLRPLTDIAPDYVHPVHRQSVADLLDEVSTAGVTRYPRHLTLPDAAAASD